MKFFALVFSFFLFNFSAHAQSEDKKIEILIENHFYEKAKFTIDQEIKKNNKKDHLAYLEGNLAYVTMRLGDAKKGLEIAKKTIPFYQN